VRMRQILRASAGAVLSAVALPLAAAAQLPTASAASVALGGSFTTLARNFNAVAWNPANLGLPGNSGFSFTLLPLIGNAAAGPISVKDFAEYDGVLIPDAAKREWVQRVIADGSQAMDMEAGITWAALSIGRIGLQLGSSAHGSGNLSPETIELLLFGNAGFNNGTPKRYTLAGSKLDASVLTTVGASYAQSISLKLGPLPNQTFSIGGTAKYVVGNLHVSGVETGGVVNDNPLELRVSFPAVISDSTSLFNGAGVAFDVGAAWQGGPFRAGAVVRNLFSTFSWDTANWSYVPVVVKFTGDSSEASTDKLPYSQAPQVLRDQVREEKLDPTLAVGLAFSGLGPLHLMADVRQQLGDGIKLGPKSQISLGAELRLIPFLPIRGGLAQITGGQRFSGGLGLELGLINLQLGAALNRTDTGEGVQGAISLSFGGR
jgi:hypothetical protein